jgi:hypothetical protein
LGTMENLLANTDESWRKKRMLKPTKKGLLSKTLAAILIAL